jgi:hypothetical protein
MEIPIAEKRQNEYQHGVLECKSFECIPSYPKAEATKRQAATFQAPPTHAEAEMKSGPLRTSEPEISPHSASAYFFAIKWVVILFIFLVSLPILAVFAWLLNLRTPKVVE